MNEYDQGFRATLPASVAKTHRQDPRAQPEAEELARAQCPDLLKLGSEDFEIGRYKISRPLGQGAMGTVYAAYDPQLDREVALKLLHQQGDEKNAHTQLIAEARSLAQLAHPNVVPIYEVGLHKGAAFLAMEMVVGQTLRQWVEARPRRFQEMLRMYIEVGRGLAASHSVGVVHRDFKPDNVLVGEDGRPRLVDFGLAARVLVDSETAKAQNPVHGILLGTPAYMSPEQWRGEPVDARSDQYAFCVSLFETLYGHLPFRGETLNQLMLAVLEGPTPVVEERVSVHTIIMRGLSRDPGARFANLRQLLDELDAVLEQSQPGLFADAKLWVLAVLGPIFVILPLTWFGLELTSVVDYRASNWAVLSAIQVTAVGTTVLLLRRSIIAVLGHPRLLGVPKFVLLFLLGHRAIAFGTGSELEVMFAYDFLAFTVLASVIASLVERAVWTLAALMALLTTTSVLMPAWAPRLWIVLSVGLPLFMSILAMRRRSVMPGQN